MTKNFLKIACAAVLLFAGSARAEIDGAKAENFVKDVTALLLHNVPNFVSGNCNSRNRCVPVG